MPLIQKGRRPINVWPRPHILEDLAKEAGKHSFGRQVLMCFSGDPYCLADEKYKTTREVLKILLENHITVAVLTKGGKRCLRDIDLFRRFKAIKIGATLTFIQEKDSIYWERKAALPEERFKTLEKLKEEGIKTWVSLEPVIDPEQTLRIIDRTYKFIDQYKVGKLNHYPSKIDWGSFGLRAIDRLNRYGKEFYIKSDLAEYIPAGMMTRAQRDMDYFALRGK